MKLMNWHPHSLVFVVAQFCSVRLGRRRVPSSPPVVASPVQSRHAQLMRSSVHTHEKCSSLRPAHESNPNSRSVRKAIFTAHTILHRSQISFRPISDARWDTHPAHCASYDSSFKFYTTTTIHKKSSQIPSWFEPRLTGSSWTIWIDRPSPNLTLQVNSKTWMRLRQTLRMVIFKWEPQDDGQSMVEEAFLSTRASKNFAALTSRAWATNRLSGRAWLVLLWPRAPDALMLSVRVRGI